MYAADKIGLAKISLISLSEIVAKCNASAVGEREVSLLSMNSKTRVVAERGRKKRARDVKIRKNKCRGIAEGKKADSEKRVKHGERVHAREPEFARVSNILFLLALAKLIERGRYPHSPSCIFFFSFSPTFNKARSV